ncbi:C40 family peptidase [Lacticaseibacillus sp. GG6-2]
MTESTKALAIAAGLAGVAGAATLAVAPNQVSAATGTVTYADGATTVWQTPAFKSVKRYVVKDQSIAILGQKTINGTTWYKIGAGEWIPEIYLQVQGTTPEATSTANAATAKATATTADTFAVQATYTEGAVTIWNGTNYTSASGKYLTTDSNLTAVATVQANGETWYKLSDGGYVPARFAAKAGSAEATAAAATATKTATTATVKTATPAPATTATPADTTNTSTGATAEDTASTAANATAAASTSTTAAPAAKATTPTTTATPAAKASAPATAATTPAAATPKVAATTQSTATPKASPTTATASQSLTVTYTDSVVTEWKSAGYTQTAGKYLTSGTTVTAVGTTTANGETWYQLSDGNYVSARFFGAQGKANSSAAKAAATTQTTATPVATTPAKAATPAPTTQSSTPATTNTQASANTASTTQATQTNTQAQTSTQASTATPVNTVKQTTAASANGSRAARIAAVISVAKAQLGKPYVWGGKGPSSFDCSGLTHYAYLNGANKEIGGYTGAQENAGTVVSLANLQVGDLVFWGSRGSTYHVAIYLGGNQYIAAPQPGESVKISSISSYFMPSFGVRVL